MAIKVKRDKTLPRLFEKINKSFANQSVDCQLVSIIRLNNKVILLQKNHEKRHDHHC